MRTGSDVFRFGPFELDSADRRLMRGRERVPLPDTLVDVLLLLVSHPGEILSNDALWEAGWKGIAVTPNTVIQGVKRLRKALGLQKDGREFIENVHKHGYRFVASATHAQTRQRNVAVDALLAPFMTFVKGRAWLETLDLAAVRRALLVFEEAVSLAPDHAAAHIGLANACAMLFESTRTDAAPDLAVLQRAHVHALTACDLDGVSGDAWSTLAFVLHRLGEGDSSIAAARRAIALERDEWRHWLVLASVSWGGQRLRAARRVMGMYEGLAFAHWFAATVYVARGDFDEALAELRAGCAAQDAQRQQTDRFHAVGLHLLHGLVLAALGRDEEALEELARERACLDAGHIYARECSANCCYAIGAIRLRLGQGRAAAAFQEALTCVPGHVFAAIGLAAASGQSGAGLVRPADAASLVRPAAANSVDAALAKAVALSLQGKHDEAGRVCGEAIRQADPGSRGWMTPVEPLLHPTGHCAAWAHALAILRHRAA
jgi:DNA-binding winged helix-turn-helix (wHTH) protein